MGLDAKKTAKKKKKLGSYPYSSVVFSITLALFVIGLFGLLLLHSHKLTKLIKENIEVQAYLHKNLSESERISVLQTLSSKEYIYVKEGEPQITFISKEEALEAFVQNNQEDPLNILGENPLRDAYRIKIDPQYQDSIQLSTLKTDIESLNGVFEVSYPEDKVNYIVKNITKISLILIGFSAILLLTVIILINNTIKLALFSQRFLIRSMQLVGATSGFIQKPFLLRSILHGFMAGILASALLYLLLQYATGQIEALVQLQELNQILLLFVSLILIGMLIGFFSTFRAIRKYIRMSLDDLY